MRLKNLIKTKCTCGQQLNVQQTVLQCSRVGDVMNAPFFFEASTLGSEFQFFFGRK